MIDAKEKFKKNLTELSLDSANGVSLVENDKLQMLCLDDMAVDTAENLRIDSPSSCDALYMKEKEIYVIEFKNRKYSKMSSRDKREIREKAYYSIGLLTDMMPDKSLEELKTHTTLFVVFQEMDEEPSYSKIVDTFNRYANKEEPVVRCQLGVFKEKYYRNIYTVGKKDFETVYLPQIYGEEAAAEN